MATLEWDPCDGDTASGTLQCDPCGSIQGKQYNVTPTGAPGLPGVPGAPLVPLGP